MPSPVLTAFLAAHKASAPGTAGQKLQDRLWLLSDRIELNSEVLAAAAESKAWPFEEARKIIDRYQGAGFPRRVLFETGYGPSGLPHIGTFGEVARTTMVRHAFRVLTEDKVKTRAAVLFRRHGRDAQGARQRAEPGHAERASAASR